ncbi:MAG: hypothetical protein LBH97_01195 [Treponema sp.]|jgi:hypothetical protein|nr:hypothetical protein [Treponema sp.]
MNTIPTIFNEIFPAYTVIGGRERLGSTGISAVLLNRSGRYARRSLFYDLEKTGFDNVISVESAPDHYDVEELAERFPFARFILPREGISLGEQINLAASELDSHLFFVMWNDLKIIAGGTARRMAERLGVEEESCVCKRLCTVPLILNSRYETLPTLIAPGVFRRKVRTLFFPPNREGLPSLYPFDGVGIYDRERFIRLGGFDTTLGNTYWQLMDFGFRAHLWGEDIVSTQTLKLSYDGTIPPEDTSAGESYRRFYLKNLAPVFRGDYAHLPLRRFPGYLLKSGEGPASAWEDFSEGRRWVSTNRFRWRCDIRALAGRWDDAPAAETGTGSAGD